MSMFHVTCNVCNKCRIVVNLNKDVVFIVHISKAIERKEFCSDGMIIASPWPWSLNECLWKEKGAFKKQALLPTPGPWV